ncbi:hypothetical protein DPMN_021132 [Dreissena polymorpha]|uniref:Uncharacterized protein n=1 Tax=Dreissena polymorpha TaxID=45954 RepID=A0A9D4NLN5_DREPO|nr:hypothetical protein DPMN_021132 [Dreissena polymorpha]
MWAGPGLVMGPCIAELDLNRCRNEEIIVKGNFGWAWSMWAWPMWAGFPRLRLTYQFEMNRCRNEEIIVIGNFWWAWPMWPGRPRIYRIVIKEAQYQFEVNRCRNEEVFEQVARMDRQTDGQTHIITISPLFLRKTWG